MYLHLKCDITKDIIVAKLNTKGVTSFKAFNREYNIKLENLQSKGYSIVNSGNTLLNNGLITTL